MSESGEAPRIGVRSEGEQQGGMPWIRSLGAFRVRIALVLRARRFTTGITVIIILEDPPFFD